MPKREEVNFSFAGEVSLAYVSRVVNTAAQHDIAGLFARSF